MKTLVVSLKSPSEALNDFSKALKKAKSAKGKVAPHYEIAFDNKKDFERFIRNISVLMAIQSFHPKSIYELANIMETDQSNLNKTMLFLEGIGAVHIKEHKVDGRLQKTPMVNYDKIEFKLKAA